MAVVLLVEDDVLNRDMIRRRLIYEGYQIVVAKDGAEALSLVSETRPDLILMDMGLPILNGWRVTEMLKQNAATSTIPIIALTAFAMKAEQQRSMQVGCDAFESKPIDFRRLLGTIERLLKS